ncbi:MAG: NfeD family protein, partial [Burkholderiaceae bacterium]|nr:NfeD family protein [Burkholderiaceae bacterium]
MDDSTIWWLLSGIAVAAELLTGTFYLLMLGIGLAAAALAAHLGLPLTAQIVTAAAVGGGAVVAWNYRQKHRPGDPAGPEPSEVQLDIGETVYIDHWNPDGTATVKYRGAPWTAIHRAGATPSPGPHRVAELVGSRLLVDPVDRKSV